ncbi:MAG: TRAP transporter large permease subunit [Alphaproteobacteria bacterium]|nr:TRAP transporter large permease subunit [Alphaproteobacteria bacterium]
MAAPLSLLLVCLAVLLASGLWIGFTLIATGAVTLMAFRDMPVGALLAFDLWSSFTATELASLPLFIFMGEILFNTRLSESMFKGLAPWTRRIPGRLLHVNVIGCTLFAAVSGSSTATTATIGRMTMSELTRRGYSMDLAMGSLCGAGTLGFLIPPSIIMIVYGVLAQVSILDLFIAGVVPGVLLALSFMAYIGFRAVLTPALVPPQEPSTGWDVKLKAIVELGPIVLLIGMVIGSMYAGLAGPSEAATIGVFGALIIAGLQRCLSLATLKLAVMASLRTCSMIGLILAGALFVSKAAAFLQLPESIAASIAALALSPFALIILLMLLYIVLGCIIDGMSAIVLTLPIVLPLIVAAGFSPVWFGIFLVIVVEMSQVTPPVGFNLFVVQGLTGESMGRVARAAFPFFMIMAGFVALITLVPDIVLALPASMK